MTIKVYFGNDEFPNHFAATIWDDDGPIGDINGDSKDKVRAAVLQHLEGMRLDTATFVFEWD